ncbi:hypothetical protein PN650_22765 [Parabacteroides distasonis]|nr:hypothetical protein [Parabacteroides distasonis]
MRLLDIVPVEEYVTVHTSVCQEAMKFVVRWDGTLRGSGVTLHLSVRARCRLVCGWRTAVWQLIRISTKAGYDDGSSAEPSSGMASADGLEQLGFVRHDSHRRRAAGQRAVHG